VNVAEPFVCAAVFSVSDGRPSGENARSADEETSGATTRSVQPAIVIIVTSVLTVFQLVRRMGNTRWER
jgi:hypothetical protein